MGWGTYGSRTTAVGGAALAVAVRKIKDKAKVLAAHLLEAAPEDMDYQDGRFFVKGTPARAKTIQDIALMANVAWNLPQGMEAGLEATSFYDPPNFVYPFGAHVAVVEIDGETGQVDAEEIRRGRRLRSADQSDDRRRPGARRRRAGHRPGALGRRGLRRQRPARHRIACSTTRFRAPTSCPTSTCCRRSPGRRTIRLGVKGIGEAGTIVSTAAVYNAVIDALEPFGVDNLTMPLTAERVWRAMQR